MRRLAPYVVVAGFACLAASAPASARVRHFGHAGYFGHAGHFGHVGHFGHFRHFGFVPPVSRIGRIGPNGPIGGDDVCSVFQRRPCVPGYPFPLGENLQLTVKSAENGQGETVSGDHRIDTIADLFAALRACWQPPEDKDAHEGMQMSVRFSFKRNGELIGEPRVTYSTPGIDDDTRQVYRHAIDRAIERCTPLPFTDGMGGAIAGRPIAIRFIDDRNTQKGNSNDR